MFDTIYIELPIQSIKDLDDKSDTIDSETGEVRYSVGFTDCIKIRKVGEVMTVECSLPKLLKRNNIYSLSFSEVGLALKMIEDKLGISIQQGIVRRIDCHYTFETELKVREYFRYLGDCKYFRRSNIDSDSLYYSNESRVFNFYDKIKEIKSKRDSIPYEFIGKNIMRCEFRYKTKYLKIMSSKLGIEKLKIENLTDRNTYNQIAELVYADYQSITKIRQSYFDEVTISSKAKFQEQFVFAGVMAYGGLNAVLDKIDASKALNKNLSPEYFSRRKSEIKNIMKINKQNIEGECINEINYKIEQIHLQRLDE
ncbi:hypothetical protein G6N05_07850 [Flavobacterium sp. F372]|uniref:Replication-associated protein G2P N-terminal domain-containing protein n=1 Tax=Flavobacterium bernardetii TaxID=2813823 RepID=A0ABR7IX34_9FLAO|nr:phage/plasmid replication protein [Flavobacterium bernardetii]MBC5834341.1 hypothetical protein [Flavobacterium bernardetii]NHF70020.1 hypothetical protein [Flavobacterium bernardetii]